MDGFTKRLKYINVYMAHCAPKAMGQLRVSLHQVEIEARRVLHIPRTKRLCKLSECKVKHKEILTLQAMYRRG